MVKPAATPAGLAKGQCLCGAVAFEIDVPARWAWHIAIEELQEWAYTGEPLVPLKGFPGVVWQRSKRKWRPAGDDPFELAREEP